MRYYRCKAIVLYLLLSPSIKSLEVHTRIQEHATRVGCVEIVFDDISKTEVEAYLEIDHLVLSTTT